MSVNTTELLAFVEECEKKGKQHITLPREDVKELLQNFKPAYGVPWPASELESQ